MNAKIKIVSKAFIIVGQTGTGKSTVAKSLLSQVYSDKVLVYDVQGEYSEFNDDENVIKSDTCTFDEFLEMAENARGKMILFEEASIFFNARSSDLRMIKMLVDKRHHNNVLILVFHSLRKVPNHILDLCNYLLLLPTNDSLEVVKRKFEGNKEIIDIVENNKTQKFKPITIKLI